MQSSVTHLTVHGIPCPVPLRPPPPWLHEHTQRKEFQVSEPEDFFDFFDFDRCDLPRKSRPCGAAQLRCFRPWPKAYWNPTAMFKCIGSCQNATYDIGAWMAQHPGQIEAHGSAFLPRKNVFVCYETLAMVNSWTSSCGAGGGTLPLLIIACPDPRDPRDPMDSDGQHLSIFLRIHTH